MKLALLDAMRISYDLGRKALQVDPGDLLRPGRVVELLLLPGIVDLDGQPLGEHQGGYTPFEFELTGHIQWGREQQVVLRVDDTPHPYNAGFTMDRFAQGRTIDEAGYGPYNHLQ